MKTGIYCRVSTEEQVDGFSINAQIDKLTKYADSCDWEVVDYYIDEGISGKNLCDRDEVKRLIDDVICGKINNILVYKLDRITRSMKDLIYLIELFDKYNCTFNSQTEKIDTSNAVGRMFIKIIGIFAEFERENLAERVSFGYEQKTREGNYTNCNGVYGYDYFAVSKAKTDRNHQLFKVIALVGMEAAGHADNLLARNGAEDQLAGVALHGGDQEVGDVPVVDDDGIFDGVRSSPTGMSI